MNMPLKVKIIRGSIYYLVYKHLYNMAFNVKCSVSFVSQYMLPWKSEFPSNQPKLMQPFPLPDKVLHKFGQMSKLTLEIYTSLKV